MRELPTGTVTLLFSDIEGSTALLSRAGERYAGALSAQRVLMRAAISACGGMEMGTEGDSFYVVFESASAALECCLAAQRALAGYPWPDGCRVRVRMGLHSGEPAPHEDGYVGMDVHRAARIAAAAHGGQVVLSEPTRLLAEPQLPAGTGLLDLGWHRLKDIDAPERIYQLTTPDLEQRFPPLKSLGARSSLPPALTALVGRDSDLQRLRGTLTEPGVRLVTLTGTGGVGKTRLALAAAGSLDRAFEHGVYFVALAAVRDAEVMWKATADEVGISGTGSAAELVTQSLRSRQALLVLDNLEQLYEAGDVISRMLAAAPRLVVLATSRRPLHVPGEHEQLVRPLDLTSRPAAAGVGGGGAVQLFTQQAALVRPGFTVTAANAADVTEICRRLDGLPLAIEVAASRLKLLTPQALRARLADSLDMAAADVGRPSRQQTLRNTLSWSYELLGGDLAAAFRRMAVFAGGCDLDALAAVAASGPDPPDALQLASGLLDVSLITVTDGADGEPRIRMLETIRHYALELLQRTGDCADARRRHASYYADFAEAAGGQLRGPRHVAALSRLSAEHDNLRAALAWALDTRQDGPAADPAADADRTATGVRLANALGQFWYQHGHAGEGRRWLERAVAMTPDQAGAPLARLAHKLALLLRQQGELEAAILQLERSLKIWRELGDRAGEARELNTLAIAHRHRGSLDTARSLFEESLAIARELRSGPRVSVRLSNLGSLEVEAGNVERAIQVLQEAVELLQTEGDPVGLANAQDSLAIATLSAGHADQAWDVLSRSFDYVVSSGEPGGLAIALESAACIAAALGNGLSAARYLGAADGLRHSAGIPIPEPDAAIVGRFLEPARTAIAADEWAAAQAAGRSLTHAEAATLLTSAEHQ